MIHTQERFKQLVAELNRDFGHLFIFQLVGSLSEGLASDHDADIVVHPAAPKTNSVSPKSSADAFVHGIRLGGEIKILAIDKDSKTPFPGRPEGQDRVRVRFSTEEEIDFFFVKY